jgi:hypothetical protein
MPTSERSAEASRMVCACMLSLSAPPNVSACRKGTCRLLVGRRAKWRLVCVRMSVCDWAFAYGDGNGIF